MLPRTESYLRRCARVFALVRSLTATKSMFLSPIAARMMLRPIRPNPFIPTLTGIVGLRYKQSILMNGVAEGQTIQLYCESFQSFFMYFTYSLVTFLAFAALSPYFVYQAIRY